MIGHCGVVKRQRLFGFLRRELHDFREADIDIQLSIFDANPAPDDLTRLADAFEECRRPGGSTSAVGASYPPLSSRR